MLMTKRVKNIPVETPAIAAVDAVFGAFKTQIEQEGGVEQVDTVAHHVLHSSQEEALDRKLPLSQVHE